MGRIFVFVKKSEKVRLFFDSRIYFFCSKNDCKNISGRESEEYLELFIGEEC